MPLTRHLTRQGLGLGPRLLLGAGAGRRSGRRLGRGLGPRWAPLTTYPCARAGEGCPGHHWVRVVPRRKLGRGGWVGRGPARLRLPSCPLAYSRALAWAAPAQSGSARYLAVWGGGSNEYEAVVRELRGVRVRNPGHSC